MKSGVRYGLRSRGPRQTCADIAGSLCPAKEQWKTACVASKGKGKKSALPVSFHKHMY